jgi:hypothetical protein
MSNPPSCREEINRKTWEALGTLLNKLKRAEITDEHFKVAVDTLWEAVSGLADKDLVEFFGKIGDLKLKETKQLFRRGDQVVSVVGSAVGTTQLKPTSADSLALANRLSAKGFTRIL